jgi:hypothetical protein
VRSAFLSPITRDSPDRYSLWNARTDRALARVLEPAFASTARNKGLLGRTSLDADAAMILAPCRAIHSFFMQFAIDVVFVDRDGVAIKIRPALPPWRIAFALRAFAVVELPIGALASTGTIAGDRLLLRRQ